MTETGPNTLRPQNSGGLNIPEINFSPGMEFNGRLAPANVRLGTQKGNTNIAGVDNSGYKGKAPLPDESV